MSPAHPTKALVFGYYGVRNLGDEMMLYCLRHWLEQQGVTVVVLSENPVETRSQHHLRAIRNVPLLGQWAWYYSWFRGGAIKVVREINAADIVIGGGGDCIRDDFSRKAFSYSVEKYLLALLLGKRICLLNVGLGRLRTRWARRVLAWILRRSSKTVVRDQRSLEICTALGVSDVQFAPDIVLTLPRHLNAGTSSLAQEPSPSYVLVCLRANPNAYGRYELTEARLSVLAAALDNIVAQHDFYIVFLPFQCEPQGIDDNQLHREIVRRMSRAGRANVEDWTSDLRELSHRFAGARIVVAMRLHAAVMAVAYQRPCVLMPYDEKVVEFGRQRGIPYSIDPAALDSLEGVVAVLENCLANDQTLTPRVPPDSWDTLRL